MATFTPYRINSTDLPLLPSSGAWQERQVLGLDGNNRKIYEPLYSFLLVWDLLSPSEFKTLYDYWKSASAAGTVSATLPPKGGSIYEPFTTYTGCVPDEPIHGEFFQKYIKDVKWLIRNITVS